MFLVGPPNHTCTQTHILHMKMTKNYFLGPFKTSKQNISMPLISLENLHSLDYIYPSFIPWKIYPQNLPPRIAFSWIYPFGHLSQGKNGFLGEKMEYSLVNLTSRNSQKHSCINTWNYFSQGSLFQYIYFLP